jgi:hypothetical protein
MAAFGAAYRVSKPNFGATARQVGKENLSLSTLLAGKQQIPIAGPESVHASSVKFVYTKELKPGLCGVAHNSPAGLAPKKKAGTGPASKPALPGAVTLLLF